jgi:hypothetical protein
MCGWSRSFVTQSMLTVRRALSRTFPVWLLLAGTLAAQRNPLPSERAAGADGRSLLDRAVDNQKQNEAAIDLYERIERVETRKSAGDAQPAEVKFFRIDPAGMGLHRILLGPGGKPSDPAAYRAELENLVTALEWATQSGHAQSEILERFRKRKKDRLELVEATRTAFVYTWVADEPRGDRTLSKFRMEPNPAYKPSSRTAGILSKVRGFVWIDKPSGQVARLEAEVTGDVSFGGFLGKIYKGSRFFQERYEVEPGVWLPSFTAYDFDGRKLFLGFSVHERTFDTNYRRIGTPREALPLIRAELGKTGPPIADP